MTPAIFDFEAQTVRVLMRDGQPWWVAVDVCCALGIANSRDAVAALDEDERMTVANTDSHLNVGNTDIKIPNRGVHIVSESGLFHLIFKSRKEEAKRFRKWVTSEVLPALRATGSYTVEKSDPALRDERVPTSDEPRSLPEPVRMMSVVQFLRQHGRDWPGKRQVEFTKDVRTFVRVMGAQEGKVEYGALGALYAVPEGLMQHVLEAWKAEGCVPGVNREMEELEQVLARAWELHEEDVLRADELIRVACELQLLPHICGPGTSLPARRSSFGKLCQRAEGRFFKNGLELRSYGENSRKYRLFKNASPGLRVVKREAVAAQTA